MRDCIDHHRRDMSLMTAAKGCHNARIRRGLINEAYRWLDRWLDRWFGAVEDELRRNRRIAR